MDPSWVSPDTDVFTSEFLGHLFQLIVKCKASDTNTVHIDNIKSMLKGAPLRVEEAAALLHWAAQIGNITVITAVLKEFPESRNYRCKAAGGWTALHIAAAQGHLATVRHLVEKQQVNLGVRDNKGQLAVSVTSSFEISTYLLRVMFMVREAKERRRSSVSALETHSLGRPGAGRLFDYLAVVEIGIGAPLRKRQVSQGWTPMRVLNRFPHDSWSDFRYEEIDWCALAQFIPHPEPGQSVFHHYRQNRRSRSASAASHAAGQRAGHAKSPSDPSLPTAQPVHDVVAAGDTTAAATPGSRRHALLRANAEAAVAQTRKDADKASIIADMLLDAETELQTSASRRLSTDSQEARESLASRLRSELKQAKRQSRRSAQVAADAALALRDFERSYLSSPSNGDDGKDGAGRFSSSARTDHSPSTCDGEQQHGIPDSSDDLPGDGPKQSSGGSTWSSGTVNWMSTDANGDTFYCMCLYFPAPNTGDQVHGDSSLALVLVSHHPLFSLANSVLRALVDLCNLPHNHFDERSSQHKPSHPNFCTSFSDAESPVQRLRKAIPVIFQLQGLDPAFTKLNAAKVANVAARTDSPRRAIDVLVKAAVASAGQNYFTPTPIPAPVRQRGLPRRLRWQFKWTSPVATKADCLNLVNARLPPNGSHELGCLPYLDHTALHTLLRLLSPSNIATLIGALLLEHNVVLLATDFELLTPAADALRALLFPLRWVQVYVPYIPRPFLSMVQSPVPFIMGTHVDNYAIVSQHLSKLSSAESHGTFVVNLHHDEVIPPILYSSQGAPALPKPLMKAITQALHDEDWLQTSIEGLLTSAMDAAKAPRNPRRPSLSHRPLQRSQAVHSHYDSGHPFNDESRWKSFEVELMLTGTSKLGLVLRRASVRANADRKDGNDTDRDITDAPANSSGTSDEAAMFLVVRGFRTPQSETARKLRVGDVIQFINGRRTMSTRDVKAVISAKPESVVVQGFRAVRSSSKKRPAHKPAHRKSSAVPTRSVPRHPIQRRWSGGLSPRAALHIRMKMLEAFYLLLAPIDVALLLVESPSDEDRLKAIRNHPLITASSQDIATETVRSPPMHAAESTTAIKPNTAFLKQFLCTSMFLRFGSQMLCIDDDISNDLQVQLSLFLKYAQLRRQGQGCDDALKQCFPTVLSRKTELAPGRRDLNGKPAHELLPTMDSAKWFNEVGRFLFSPRPQQQRLVDTFCSRSKFSVRCDADRSAVARCINAFSRLSNVKLRFVGSDGLEGPAPYLSEDASVVDRLLRHAANDPMAEMLWQATGPLPQVQVEQEDAASGEDGGQEDEDSDDSSDGSSTDDSDFTPPAKPVPELPTTTSLPARDVKSASPTELAARLMSEDLATRENLSAKEFDGLERGVIHLIQSLTATEKGRLALHAQAQELQVSHSEAMQFLVRQVEKQLLRKVIKRRGKTD